MAGDNSKKRAAQCSAAQRSAMQRSAAQRNAAQRSAAQCSAAPRQTSRRQANHAADDDGTCRRRSVGSLAGELGQRALGLD
jgi:hypothetical protein